LGCGREASSSWARENRLALAQRLADGMRRAWDSTKRQPISAADVIWTVESVALPPATNLTVATLESNLTERAAAFVAAGGPSRLAWLRRCQAGHQLDIQCLRLGRARILHLPGELFVEYQLAAKAMRPDLFVALAAYGDYAPWYVGTAAAYRQGGYETGPDASNVAPEVEAVLMTAMRKVLSLADR
jgi:hypothetical protein